MNAVDAIAEGLRRTARAPKLVLGLWLVNLAAALPAAFVISGVLEDSIGPSLFHRSLRHGFDADWYDELRAETGGVARTFGPEVIGIGAVYENLEAWWSGRLFTGFPAALVALGVAYALLWSLLLGGILETLGRRPAHRSSAHPPAGLAGFIAAGGRTFGRFVALAAAAGVAYFLIYRLARALYGWLETATRDVTRERAVLAAVLAIAALVVALLHLVRLVFDYAKIAAFADDLPALAAAGRALTFVAANAGTALAVYGGLGLAAVALIVLYAWLAPGAGQSSAATVVLAFLLSQAYLVARLAVRLSLLASELHFYRASSPAA